MTLREQIEALCNNAGAASRKLALASTEEKNRVLLRIAECMEQDMDALLQANGTDIQQAEAAGRPCRTVFP